MTDLLHLPSFSAGAVTVVVETARGMACKLAYEDGIFRYVRALPVGLVYPYDWGFIPSTLGEDGDPLDGLVLHEAATVPGAVIDCQLLGALRVSQRNSDGSVVGNDRFMLAPSRQGAPYQPSDDILSDRVKAEIEQFFLAAVIGTGKELDFEGWAGRDEAKSLIESGRKSFEECA